MKPTDIVKTIINKKGMKFSFIASKMNTNRAVFYQRLTQNNISINKLNEILKTLNFKIIIVPEDTKIENPDWYEVTTEVEE